MPTPGTDGKALQTGKQIYNAIMSQIEPELVTTSTVKVDASMPGETPEEFAARMERYRKAFALYEQCFDAYVAHVREESRQTRLDARHAAEQKLHDEDEAEANKLLTEMTHA